jgi:hypothetical protein
VSCALGDAPQSLPQIPSPAHERDFVTALVDVMLFIGRRQHLALVDVVHAQRLEHASFREMANAGLGHYGNRNRAHDVTNDADRSHARHPALFPDIGGHALERHHGRRAGVFGDLRLLYIGDVHDDAALEHFGQTYLQTELFGGVHDTSSMPASTIPAKESSPGRYGRQAVLESTEGSL